MIALGRTAALKGYFVVALTFAGVLSSTAWGNAPAPPQEPVAANAPAATEELPLRLIYDSSAKCVTLTVPKKFAAAFQKNGKSVVLPVDVGGGRSDDGWRFVATVIGGAALSLGLLLLGLWIVRRPTAAKRKLIGGTIAGIAFFVGLTAVFADVAIPDRETPTTIKIVFVEEGDRLELTQP